MEDNSRQMLLDLPKCQETEWKLLNYLTTCKKCWTCLGENNTTNDNINLTDNSTSTSTPDDKVHARMERLLGREPSFRHILLLLTTRKRNKFHLGVDDFYQNCCASCTEIFKNLVILEEEVEQVEAKICTNFAVVLDKRKLSPLKEVLKVEEEGIEAKTVDVKWMGGQGGESVDNDKVVGGGEENIWMDGIVDNPKVGEQAIIKDEPTSDLEEFVLGLEFGGDDEMETGDESGPEIEPDLDSDFNPENDEEGGDNNSSSDDGEDPDFSSKNPSTPRRRATSSSTRKRRQNRTYPAIQDPDNIICPVCPPPISEATPPRRFDSMRRWKYHYDYHHLGMPTPKPHSCPHCDHTFQRKHQLLRHIFKLHPDQLPPDQDPATFLPRKKEFPCSACGKVLASKLALTGHELLVCHVPLDKSSLPCKINIYDCKVEGCSAQFYTKKGLGRHIATHTGAQSYPCDRCGATFTRPDSLKGHVNYACKHGARMARKSRKRKKTTTIATTPPEPSPPSSASFPCPHCHRTFKVRSAHEKHMQTCLTPKPIGIPAEKPKGICDICGKSMLLLEVPIHKRRVHEGEKPHTCKYCGKGFFHPNNLKLHAKHVHEEKGKPRERKFVCEICGKAFCGSGNLYDHKNRVHFRMHRFACDYCGMKFCHKNDIRKHFKGHENKGEARVEFDQYLIASTLPERTRGFTQQDVAILP